MKNKVLIYWFILQVIFVFITTGFLVSRKSDLAGNMFVIFIVQLFVFICFLLNKKENDYLNKNIKN